MLLSIRITTKIEGPRALYLITKKYSVILRISAIKVKVRVELSSR